MRSLQDVRGDFRGCWLWSSGLEMIRYCKPGSNGQGPGLGLDSSGASPSRGLIAEAGSTTLGSASALGVLVLPNHPFALGIFPLGACSTFTSPRCPAPAPAHGSTLVYLVAKNWTQIPRAGNDRKVGVGCINRGKRTGMQMKGQKPKRKRMQTLWGREQRSRGKESDKDPQRKEQRPRDCEGQEVVGVGAELKAEMAELCSSEVRVSVRSAAVQGQSGVLVPRVGGLQVHQDALRVPQPEPWRSGRNCLACPWCPSVPRPLRYWGVCPSGAGEGRWG